MWTLNDVKYIIVDIKSILAIGRECAWVWPWSQFAHLSIRTRILDPFSFDPSRWKR
jgi:hypothetical protein